MRVALWLSRRDWVPVRFRLHLLLFVVDRMRSDMERHPERWA